MNLHKIFHDTEVKGNQYKNYLQINNPNILYSEETKTFGLGTHRLVETKQPEDTIYTVKRGGGSIIALHQQRLGKVVRVEARYLWTNRAQS